VSKRMNATWRPSGENVGQESFCAVFGIFAPPVPSALMIQIPPPAAVPAPEFAKTIRFPSAAQPGWEARMGRSGVEVVTARRPVPSALTTKSCESV
jgi:hypothetical protein